MNEIEDVLGISILLEEATEFGYKFLQVVWKGEHISAEPVFLSTWQRAAIGIEADKR